MPDHTPTRTTRFGRPPTTAPAARAPPLGVGKLSDRFGKWDDQSVVYRADDPKQHVAWGRVGWAYAIGTGVAGVSLFLARVFDVQLVATAVLGVGSLVFVVAYVVWRRRRNRRLTGSP